MRTGRRLVVGWREWVSLPALRIDAIKAKLDTGARTSALHAHQLRAVCRDGVELVTFVVHPMQRSSTGAVAAELPIVDERTVRSSTGHTETRPVVRTVLRMGGVDVPMELTLANRDQMGFRLLVGRTSLAGRFVVDPGRSYAGGGKGGARSTSPPPRS